MELWEKFRDREYRKYFTATQIKLGIPHQINAIMRVRGISDRELAELAGVSQRTIARATSGDMALNTVIRIAAGLDVAFIGQFVPFSALGDWFLDISDEKLGGIPSFEVEDKERDAQRIPEAC